MIRWTLIVMAFLFSGGCSTVDYDPYVTAAGNQLETRSYQTRDFENIEYKQLIQAVISTLQDYHWRMLEVDVELGTLTAYQLTSYDPRIPLGGRTELTVFIKLRADQHFAVRMNMSTGLKVENEPELYQQFFAAVRKNLHYQRSV